MATGIFAPDAALAGTDLSTTIVTAQADPIPAQTTEPQAESVAQRGGLPPLLPGRGLLANILAGALLGAASGVGGRQRGAGAVLSGLGSGFTANLGARQQIQQRQQQQSNFERTQALAEQEFQAKRQEQSLKNLKTLAETGMIFEELGEFKNKAARDTQDTFGSSIRPVTAVELQERARLGRPLGDLLLPVGQKDENGVPAEVAFVFTDSKAPAKGVRSAKIGKEEVRVKCDGMNNEDCAKVFLEAVKQAGQRARSGDKKGNIALLNFVSDAIFREAEARFAGTVSPQSIDAILREQQLDPNSLFNRMLQQTDFKASEALKEVNDRTKSILSASRAQQVIPQELRLEGQAPRTQAPPAGGEPQLGTTLQVGTVPEVLVLRTVQGQRPDQATLKRLAKNAGGAINVADGTLTLPPGTPPDVRRQIQEVLGSAGILIVPQQ